MHAHTHTHRAHGMTKTQTHIHTKAGRHTCAQGDMQTGAYTCIHANTDHTQCTHVPFRSCVDRWSVECCGRGFVLPQSLAEATESQVLPLPWTQQCHISQSQSTHHGEAAPIPSGCRGRGGPDWEGTCPDHSTRICDWNPRILTLASIGLCTATQGSSLRMTMRAEQIVGQEPFLPSTPPGGASAQQGQSLSWPRPSTAPRGRPSSTMSWEEHSPPDSSAPAPGQARHARG